MMGRAVVSTGKALDSSPLYSRSDARHLSALDAARACPRCSVSRSAVGRRETAAPRGAGASHFWKKNDRPIQRGCVVAATRRTYERPRVRLPVREELLRKNSYRALTLRHCHRAV